MNASVIIKIAAGFVPPAAYIEQALKHCPTCFGIAIKDGEGDNAVIDVVREHKSISVEKMMAVLEGCKDNEVILTLGNMSQDFNPDEDMMPFVFQQAASGEEEDPENILAVFLEGDASNYSKVGEGHTETFNLWEDLIFPTISEKFEASADLFAFYDKLRTSAFKQTIENAFSHRGVAVFMPLIGDVISLGRNDLGNTFDWGKTSNTFGWGAETTKPKTAKAGGKLKGRLANLIGGTPEKETHTTDDKGIHHIPEQKKEEPKAIISEGHKGPMIMKPPAKLQGNARNSWIRLFTGQFEGPMPADHHKKDFTVEVPENLVPFALEDVSTKDQVRSLGKRVNAARTASKMDTAHEQIQDPKVVETKPAEAPAQPQVEGDVDTRPVSDFLPDLSADDKKGSVDLVTDWATRPSDKMPNALDIQRIESKWPVFSSMMGIKAVDMLNWGIADIKELAKKYPDAMALAFLEMKSIAVANGAFKEHFETLQKAKDKKPEPAKVEKKEEIVAAKPAGKKLSRLERLTQAA